MSTQPNQMGHPAAAYSAATPTAARTGWFSRNWKWFVPLILIVIVGLPVALIGSVAVVGLAAVSVVGRFVSRASPDKLREL